VFWLWVDDGDLPTNVRNIKATPRLGHGFTPLVQRDGRICFPMTTADAPNA